MSEDHVERRGFLRIEVYLDKLQVTVGVLGFEPTNGVVLDISRGGMKVSLDREISKLLVGDDCLVSFVDDAQDRVSAKAKLGKLLRMEGEREYAIEFTKPLEVLRVAHGEQDSES